MFTSHKTGCTEISIHPNMEYFGNSVKELSRARLLHKDVRGQAGIASGACLVTLSDNPGH